VQSLEGQTVWLSELESIRNRGLVVVINIIGNEEEDKEVSK